MVACPRLEHSRMPATYAERYGIFRIGRLFPIRAPENASLLAEGRRPARIVLNHVFSVILSLCSLWTGS